MAPFKNVAFVTCLKSLSASRLIGKGATRTDPHPGSEDKAPLDDHRTAVRETAAMRQKDRPRSRHSQSERQLSDWIPERHKGASSKCVVEDSVLCSILGCP